MITRTVWREGILEKSRHANGARTCLRVRSILNFTRSRKWDQRWGLACSERPDKCVRSGNAPQRMWTKRDIFVMPTMIFGRRHGDVPAMECSPTLERVLHAGKEKPDCSMKRLKRIHATVCLV